TQPTRGEHDRARRARRDRGARGLGRDPAVNAWIDIGLFSTTFLTLFVIMDPLGTVPIFLALTSTMTAKQRKRAARQAVLVAGGVIVSFILFGHANLDLLAISMPALPHSGAVPLLLV